MALLHSGLGRKYTTRVIGGIYGTTTHWYSKAALLAARASLFVIYFWFGALKVFHLSPADPLVQALLEKTMPFVAFPVFVVVFGLFEMLIGVIFLVPALDRISVPVFFAHMFVAAMPLVLLPALVWQQFFVPTLEGQYIIKNMALITSALVIAARRHR